MAKADTKADFAQLKDMPPLGHATGPTGRAITTNLGPGMLYPGVGKLVQRSGQPVHCGALSGIVAGYIQHPNNKDPSKTSTRFAGQFLAVKHTGEVVSGFEAYLPGALERPIKAALDIQKNSTFAAPVPFAAEIWCEPDDRPSSSLGFRYACYDRTKENANDPLLMLAYESGLIERPAAMIAGPSPETTENVDPETGEVS